MTFISSLNAALNGRGINVKSFCDTSDDTERHILMMYGAVFLADRRVTIPSRFMFDNEAQVSAFQSSLKISKKIIGGVAVQLQEAAMDALLVAAADVKKINLPFIPRGGTTAARRSYKDTADFWNNRVKDGIAHWKSVPNAKKEKLTAAEANTLNSLSGLAQIKMVFQLEARGFFFSKNKKKTILSSVAAPGSSQHLFMLAIDIEQYADARARKIMAQHGWFQTVLNDQPHFTFLGLSESVLSALGLHAVKGDGGQTFIVPQP